MSNLESSSSYLKVQYDLRPCKQVERRILLDYFRRLAGCGIPIENFRYTGMGSIHFVDHILFHKFLGIDKMVSVEKDNDIKKRIKFNRPFNNIEIEMMAIGDYIPRLDKDEQHILWLDYDYRLTSGLLNDIAAAANHLSVGSYVLVTIDVEPHKNSSGSEDNIEYFHDVARDLWDPNWKKQDFQNSLLYRRVIDIVNRAFKDGTLGRNSVKLFPVFSFLYSDGHSMVTVGGLIGKEQDKFNINKIQNTGGTYIIQNLDHEPFSIEVPVLTRKERLHFEGAVPTTDLKKVRETGVDAPVFEQYSKIYKYFPSYSELFLG